MGYNKIYNNKWKKKESPKPYKPKRGMLAPLMTEEAKQKAGFKNCLTTLLVELLDCISI